MSASTAGLDLATLRALHATRPGRATRRERDRREILARIEAHLAVHDGYVAFSGGKDSTVVVDLARRVDPAVPVVWFDSGCEYPETRAYIHDLAQRWRLNLTVIEARPSLLEILVDGGGWDHRAPDAITSSLHAALITAPAALAHEMFGPGELWGVRAAESRGRRHLFATALAHQAKRNCTGCCPETGSSLSSRSRRARHGGVVSRVDGTTAYNPIWDWSTARVWEHLAAHAIPANPLYAKLASLGAPEHATRVSHVIDGNGVETGRIVWLRRGWPDLFTQLRRSLPRIAEFS